MICRLQSFFVGLLALLTAALLALAPAQAKPASGGYQLFEPVALEHQQHIRLSSLGNFDYHAKIASECCNAPNSTVRSGLLPTELSRAVRRYGSEVQQITGYRLLGTQSNQIKNALQTADYSQPLSASAKAAHRAKFNSAKGGLIREWEINTGQTWPTYGSNAPNGRTPGAKWDAHELIPNQNGGPIEWWNISPARFPDQHQGGIHGTGSAFNNLMQLIGRQ